jgi:hypothetical protein
MRERRKERELGRDDDVECVVDVTLKHKRALKHCSSCPQDRMKERSAAKQDRCLSIAYIYKGERRKL